MAIELERICFFGWDVTYRVLPHSGIDILQRTGEMHQKQINVSKTPGLILLLGHGERVLATVVVVP
jgi:hypothetical protein